MTQIKTHSLKRLLLIILCFISIESFGQAPHGGGSGSSGGNQDIWQRSGKREASRWTLQEWLEQKDRSRMMDIWLNMNSPSPYEFEVGLWQNSYSSNVTNPASEKSYISTQGNFSAYAQIFGLSVDSENNIQEQYNDVTAKFDLRLLGNSIQNSNLTFHIGQRTRTESFLATNPQVKNLFGELSLCLHLSKFFGVTGAYRYYQPTADTTLNEMVSGSLSEGGAFIDFKAVRVFGSWFQDLQTNTSGAGVSNSATRTGYRGGLQIFF